MGKFCLKIITSSTTLEIIFKFIFSIYSETQFSPEELIAIILTKAKEYAETFTQQQITESVITVPAFFSQAERRAMLKAAELAGLKGTFGGISFKIPLHLIFPLLFS